VPRGVELRRKRKIAVAILVHDERILIASTLYAGGYAGVWVFDGRYDNTTTPVSSVDSNEPRACPIQYALATHPRLGLLGARCTISLVEVPGQR